MKRIFCLAALLLVSFSPAWSQDEEAPEAASAEESAADEGDAAAEDEVAQLAEDLVEVWEAGDVEGILSFFLEDGDYTDPSGELARGQDEVENLMGEELTTTPWTGPQEVETMTIRFAAADIATVDLDILVTGTPAQEGAAAPEGREHLFLLLVREEGQWWVHSFRHYSLEARVEGTGD